MGVNWNQGLMRWMPHINGEGKAYPLNHLHPFRFELILERGIINVSVGFAMHCFTRDCLPDDDITNFYKDDREVRTFCSERYTLSYELAGIVRDLPARHCEFAKDENFVTINTVGVDGQPILYGVFFNFKKWSDSDNEKGILLTVQSAYSLNPEKPRPGKGKVRFLRAVELVLDGIRPKPPRR